MFRIRVYENSRYQEIDASRLLPEVFATEIEAVWAAKRIVSKSLTELGFDFTQYSHFGEEPVIEGPCEGSFSAWDFARELSQGRTGDAEI